MIGTMTAGTISRTSPASLGAVQSISASPPAKISTLRSATETEELMTDSSSVVSVVMRDRTSPVRMPS